MPRTIFCQLITLFIFFSVSLSYSYANISEPIIPLRIAEHNLVILQYHHVDANTPRTTSINPEEFAKHMLYLSTHHNVIDLSNALQSIKAGEKLPDKSVAITFDDGYANIFENGHPILEQYGFPYTVFINPEVIGTSKSQLSWQQVESMQPLATFANHTLNHAHLLARFDSETQTQWLTRVMTDINTAEALLKEKLGYSKKWLAYPFGEFNTKLRDEVLKQGYIGFGQQSGAVSTFSDFGALPRYPAAGSYANLDSLKVKLNSLAMPVKLLSPQDTMFSHGDLFSQLKFKLSNDDVNFASLACYFLGSKVNSAYKNGIVVVDIDHELVPGRLRINCTARSKSLGNRYYWYSFPMFTATKDNQFLD